MSQPQTYRITNIDEATRKLAQDLLDITAISGGRKEGRLRERAYEALRGDVFTVENAEAILAVVEEAMHSTTSSDGRVRSGTLTGAGFRILSKLIKQLESIKEGDLGSGVEGVEAIEAIAAANGGAAQV